MQSHSSNYPRSLQPNCQNYVICATSHNNYEQISNTLISNRDPSISKKNGGKNGKNILKQNGSKKETVYFPHI
jgi:hypothetical protein